MAGMSLFWVDRPLGWRPDNGHNGTYVALAAAQGFSLYRYRGAHWQRACTVQAGGGPTRYYTV